MTMTTKEKRLANITKISQHALVIYLTFLQNLLLFVSSISVGRAKLEMERHSSMMSLFVVLNNFIKNIMTTKSRECSGDAENAGLEKAGLELNGHSLHSHTTAPRTKK